MNETNAQHRQAESCENCKHSYKTGARLWCKKLDPCNQKGNLILWGNSDWMPAICKHYAAPEPSEFEKAFHALSEKYPDDADYMMAAFMWRARGEADVKAVLKTHYVNSANELTTGMAETAIRKLDEGVDDG